MFSSNILYDPVRIQAAAIYCSDGRFGEQCDDFLHHALGLPRYDRLIIPGGAACLAGHFDVFRQADVIMDHIDFLIRVHGLNRLVLIAHHGCAFYTEELGISATRMASRQREDLATAAARIRTIHKTLTLQGYHAMTQDDRIAFTPVPLPADHPGW